MSRPPSVFARLASFARWFALDDLPPELHRYVRLLLLDGLGALAGSLHYPEVRALLRDAQGFDRVFGLGCAATWLDSESGGSFHPDGGRVPPVPTAHPSAHVLPILLGEGLTGAQDDIALVTAFGAATEVGLRLSVASSLRAGMHPHGVHGPMAAGLARAMLVGGVDLEQAMLWAAASPMATALRVPMGGGTVRNAWTGLGAYYGHEATDLVRAGLVVDERTVLDLFGVEAATDLKVDLLAEDLGRRWETANSYVKRYACARWIHPVLDALDEVLIAAPLAPGDITQIVVETYAFAASLDDPSPGTDMHARFSVPYCVAAFVQDRHLDARSFTESGLARPAVAQLASRVEVRSVPEYSAALPVERPAKVTVTCRDGSHHSHEVRNARGNPDDPLTVDEIVAKFRGNVLGIVGASADALVRVLVSDTRTPPGRVITDFAEELVATAGQAVPSTGSDAPGADH